MTFVISVYGLIQPHKSFTVQGLSGSWYCAHLHHIEVDFSFAEVLCPALFEIHTLSKAFPSARR